MDTSSEENLNCLNKLIEKGLPQYLAFAVVRGEISEELAFAEQGRNLRARELERIHPDKWPQPDVFWDVDPANYYLALDGSSAEEFASEFPGVEIVGVMTEELHMNLVPTSQRLKDPFSSHYRSKSARLVAHLEQGGIVTPAFVCKMETGLCFAGGNHRYGWARHRRQEKIPILINAIEKSEIGAVLNSLSDWP